MDKKVLAIVNTEISAEDFIENYYICPNNKNYSFKKATNFLASYYKKTVKYVANIRAWGVVKLIDNRFVVEEKKYKQTDKDIVDSLLIDAFEKDRDIGRIDREKELSSEGNQVFLFENIKEINASYSPNFAQFSKRYIILESSENISLDILASKISNKDLNSLDFLKVNLDEIEENIMPEYFNKVTDRSTTDIILSQKILFCNIGWMKEYKGPEEEKMRTGGAYVLENGFGGEIYNFWVEEDGYYRGYVKSAGPNRGDDFESTINLKRIDSQANDDSISNVLVVWIANNDKDKYGSRVVGFYNNATVYSQLQNRKSEDKKIFRFLIEAKKEDGFCISEQFRRKTVKRREKGFLGQSNVWYADSQENEVSLFVKEIKEYIYNILNGIHENLELKNKVNTWIISCDKSKYDVEGAFRKYDSIEWSQPHQLNSIKSDDIVYIYVGAPLSRVQYKCVVEEAGIDNPTIDDSEFMLDKSFFDGIKIFFRMRLIKKVLSLRLELSELNKNGLSGNIQGPRQLKDGLLNYIDKNVDESESQIICSEKDLEIFSHMGEEEIEAVLNAKDDSAGYALKTVLSKYRILNQQIINDLKSKYSGKCQICGEQVGGEYGEGIVQAHHIEYFCNSQNNDSSNIMILCPNHHSIIHKYNPKFNRENMCYEFSNGLKLEIKYPGHLKIENLSN